ncbi:hypothetical protein CBI55_12715 [Pseudomonas syringae]|nr:hypothetical protein CBI55_12715 [Pseudomonas syringae]POP70538.1 hypothetical protein CXB35_09145 [Pseudomonas syringae]POP82049.1 hypothetical protein CXB38_11390 [Pseudomonas syringae]
MPRLGAKLLKFALRRIGLGQKYSSTEQLCFRGFIEITPVISFTHEVRPFGQPGNMKIKLSRFQQGMPTDIRAVTAYYYKPCVVPVERHSPTMIQMAP